MLLGSQGHRAGSTNSNFGGDTPCKADEPPDTMQVRKTTECVIPFLQNVQNKKIQREKEWVCGCQGLGEDEGSQLMCLSGRKL